MTSLYQCLEKLFKISPEFDRFIEYGINDMECDIFDLINNILDTGDIELLEYFLKYDTFKKSIMYGTTNNLEIFKYMMNNFSNDINFDKDINFVLENLSKSFYEKNYEITNYILENNLIITENNNFNNDNLDWLFYCDDVNVFDSFRKIYEPSEIQYIDGFVTSLEEKNYIIVDHILLNKLLQVNCKEFRNKLKIILELLSKNSSRKTFELFCKLYEQGDYIDKIHYHCITLFCQNKNTELIKYLCDVTIEYYYYYDTFEEISYINKIFCLSCKHNNIEIMEYIMEKYKKHININIVNNDAFSLACYNGNTEIVKLLFKNYENININAKNNYAFYGACINGHIDIVKLFMKNNKQNIEFSNIVFIYCCFKGHIDVVKYLCELYPNINYDECLPCLYETDCKNTIKKQSEPKQPSPKVYDWKSVVYSESHKIIKYDDDWKFMSYSNMEKNIICDEIERNICYEIYDSIEKLKPCHINSLTLASLNGKIDVIEYLFDNLVTTNFNKTKCLNCIITSFNRCYMQCNMCMLTKFLLFFEKIKYTPDFTKMLIDFCKIDELDNF